MQRRSYSASEKLTILIEIERGEIGFNAACQKYSVHNPTLWKWQRQYKLYGYKGLENRSRNRSYSAELKLQAVLDYLKGGLSKYQVIEKHKIASITQLSNWIKKYNSHSSLKAYKGEANAMTKGRSTTYQERIDIVQYCLAHQHNINRQRITFRSRTNKCTSGSRSLKMVVKKPCRMVVDERRHLKS